MSPKKKDLLLHDHNTIITAKKVTLLPNKSMQGLCIAFGFTSLQFLLIQNSLSKLLAFHYIEFFEEQLSVLCRMSHILIVFSILNSGQTFWQEYHIAAIYYIMLGCSSTSNMLDHLVKVVTDISIIKEFPPFVINKYSVG